MTKVVLYVATSQDHFIADSSGGVSWLPQTEEETGGEDFGYRAFHDSIDALAIGRKTYEQILTFGDWPYPGKASYIFTSHPLKSLRADIEIVHDSISDFFKGLGKKNIDKLWLVGGNELAEAFYALDKIDEYILTVFPVTLKAGVPLTCVQKGLHSGKIRLIETTHYKSNVVQFQYTRAQRD